MRVDVFAITLLSSIVSYVCAISIPQLPRRHALIVRANPLRAIEHMKRQTLPTETCVPLSTQTPCDFDKICCPALSTCNGSVGSFTCVSVGTGTSAGGDAGCPSGTKACAQEDGCCPNGTNCMGNGHCDISCLDTDEPCGNGCCPSRLGFSCNTSTSQCVVHDIPTTGGTTGTSAGVTGVTTPVTSPKSTQASGSSTPTTSHPASDATTARSNVLGLMFCAVVAIVI